MGSISKNFKMKQIPLTQNKFALVDDEDFKYLNQWKWHYHKGYATRAGKMVNYKREIEKIYMHRLILNTPKGLETDHNNGDKLNNCRSNLRIVTKSQNKMNTGIRKDNISGFKGVYFDKYWDKWRSRIKKDGKQIHVGYFKSLPEAVLAYNEAAIKYFGEFARLNII